MKDNFNTYEWHDAVIKKIEIDRNNPGYNDIIEILVCWTNGIIQKVIFKNVYCAFLKMNFGVIAEETISDANIIDNADIDLQAIIDKWNKIYPEINFIKGYEINTSTTGSKLRIFAMEFEVI
jgi:hypothetical protein